MRSLDDIDIEIMEEVNNHQKKLKILRSERKLAVYKTLNDKVTTTKCVCYYEKGELIKSGRCAIHGLLALKLLDKDITYENNNKTKC